MGYLVNDDPEPPNYAAANEAAVKAQIETLPTQRVIDAASKGGTKAYKVGYDKRTVEGSTPEQLAAAREQATALGTQVEDLKTQLANTPQTTKQWTHPNGPNRQGEWVDLPNPAYDDLQSEISRQQSNLDNYNSIINRGETYTAYFDPQGNEVSEKDALLGDFTGLGDADIAALNSDKMAQVMLDLQRKYGDDYIDEARSQLERSDPEGFAARKELYDQIMGQLGEERDTTMARTLQQQIQDELEAGGTLDDQTRREVEQSVRRGQTARGNTMGNAAQFEEAMQVGTAAENRRNQRQGKALQFLTSGASADDVNYRTSQQNLSNLGAFLSGSTPTAQFQQLSGAQQGAAPYNPGQQAPSISRNTFEQAMNGANTWNTNMTNWYAQQENPWVTGINLGTSAIGNIVGMGMCWLAREVFGLESDRWKQFRFWLITKASPAFRTAYEQHAEGLAKLVHGNAMAKELIRTWMNNRLEEAYG